MTIRLRFGLKRGEYRDRRDVLFDAANAGNVRGGDAQRLLFRREAGVRDPQMHNTVLDDNLLRPYPGPLPPIEFGQQLGADFAVSAGGAGCRLAAVRRHGADEIGAAQSADEHTVAFDRDRSNARRDAYRAVDRTAAQFIRGYCDELALREARRVYSTLGPLGERR